MDPSLHWREFNTYTEALFEIAGYVHVQGFDGNWATLVFASGYSPATSAILLIHRLIRTVFNMHGGRDRLQSTTHPSQYVEKLGPVLG